MVKERIKAGSWEYYIIPTLQRVAWYTCQVFAEVQQAKVPQIHWWRVWMCFQRKMNIWYKRYSSHLPAVSFWIFFGFSISSLSVYERLSQVPSSAWSSYIKHSPSWPFFMDHSPKPLSVASPMNSRHTSNHDTPHCWKSSTHNSNNSATQLQMTISAFTVIMPSYPT